MKVEDLLKLLDAGYTKADIDAMEQQQQQQQQPQQQQPQQQQPQQPQQPQQQQQPQQPQQPNNEVLQKLGEILNAVQLSNIAGLGTGGGAGQAQTPEDVVKQMFNVK